MVLKLLFAHVIDALVSPDLLVVVSVVVMVTKVVHHVHAIALPQSWAHGVVKLADLRCWHRLQAAKRMQVVIVIRSL